MYNIAFLIFMIVNLQMHKFKFIRQVMYHILALGMAGFTFFVAWNSGSLGRNKYGTCSVRSITTGSQIAAMITLLASAIGAMIVLFVLSKYIPSHTKRFAALKRNFTNFYSTYLKISIYVWFSILLAYICQNQS